MYSGHTTQWDTQHKHWRYIAAQTTWQQFEGFSNSSPNKALGYKWKHYLIIHVKVGRQLCWQHLSCWCRMLLANSGLQQKSKMLGGGVALPRKSGGQGAGERSLDGGTGVHA